MKLSEDLSLQRNSKASLGLGAKIHLHTFHNVIPGFFHLWGWRPLEGALIP